MSSEQHSWSTFGWLRSVIGRAPSLTTCIAVYYVVLVLFGVIVNIVDPLKGILTILFFTHVFILAAPFAYGPATILVIVGVPVAIALCAVWLKGWWRVGSIMALIIGTHLFSFLYAARLYGP
jgi:hypothetical protein